MKHHLSYLKRTGRFPQNSSLKLTTRHLKMKMNITLPLRGYRGGLLKPLKKKSIMRWAKTQCCYRHIVKGTLSLELIF